MTNFKTILNNSKVRSFGKTHNSHLLTNLDSIVEQVLQNTYQYLSQFRFDAEYTQKLETAFGNDFDREVANQLFNAFAEDDFSAVPTIEVVNSHDINGANGAFSITTGKIYLAAEFIHQNAENLDAVVAVLLEEIGHSVDARINTTDAAGDEGDIFARLVQEEIISASELAVLRAEDDTATVTLNGQVVEIELRTPVLNVLNVLDVKVYISDISASASASGKYEAKITFAYEILSPFGIIPIPTTGIEVKYDYYVSNTNVSTAGTFILKTSQENILTLPIPDDDQIYDFNRTLTFNLKQSSTTTYNVKLDPNLSSRTLTITDNEPLISIVKNLDLSEGNGNGEFTIKLDKTPPQTFNLYFKVEGTAKWGEYVATKKGSDYKLTYQGYNSSGKIDTFKGTLSPSDINTNGVYSIQNIPSDTKININEINKIKITVERVNDEVWEGNETVTITLLDNQKDLSTSGTNKLNDGYGVDTTKATATVNIIDNEPTVTLGKVVNPTEGFGFGSTIEGLGAALNLNGSNSVTIPSNNSLNLTQTGQFTQEAWIFANLTDDTQRGILGSDNYPSIWVENKTTIKVGIGTKTFFVTNALNPSSWNHVATTFDGKEYKLYVNGVELVKDTTFTGTNISATKQLTIGNVSSNDNFVGAIDEVRLWNVARTQTEIQSYMLNPLKGSEQGLIGYWQFEGNLNDATTNNQGLIYLGDVTNLAGTITASGENVPNEGKAQAFDDLTNTKWLVSANNGWLQYQFNNNQSYVVTQYKITSANDVPTRDPKNWILQGSNNGSNWTNLDTRNNETFSSRFETRSFTLSNSTSYSYYRLNITANNGDSATQLAEFQLFGGTPNLDSSNYLNNPAPQIGYVEVKLDKPFEGPQGLWVEYDISAGTATQNIDYFNSRTRRVSTDIKTERNGIIIPKEKTSARIYVSALSDAVVEGDENVTITLRPTNFDIFDANNDGNYTLGQNGLLGEYYNTKDLTGTKVLSRIDSQVNFSLDYGSPAVNSPAVGVVNADNFSVRWTGLLAPAVTGTYTFYTNSDDGVRLWVNGQLIINNWTDHPATENNGSISLEQGKLYDIKLEYYEGGGGATIQLLWQPPNGSKQIIPSNNLLTAPIEYAPSFENNPNFGPNGLLAEYYNSTNFTGTPVSRIESQVNLRLDNGSPYPGVNTNNVSVRWTGKLAPTVGGKYTFYTNSDDGVRMWVNGVQIINNWTDHPATENSGSIDLEQGKVYDIKLEYYQGGGGAIIQLFWQPPAGSKEIIPTKNLFLTEFNNNGSLSQTERDVIGYNYKVGTNSTATIAIKDNQAYQKGVILLDEYGFPFTNIPSDKVRITEGSTTDTIAVTPVVTISKLNDVNEGDIQPGQFVINLSAPAPAAGLSVQYQLTGSAIAGTDYTSINAINIAPGETSAIISIYPINDDIAEGNEQVTITLLNSATGYTLGSQTTATLNIIDDDKAGITLSDALVSDTATTYTGNFDSLITSEPYPRSGDILQLFDQQTGNLVKEITLTQTVIDLGKVSISGISTNSTLKAILKESSNAQGSVNLGTVTVKSDGTVDVSLPKNDNKDTFGIRLSSKPTADVTITFNNIDSTEATFSKSSLTFTIANWDQYQSVTITGLDDTLVDGDIKYTVTAKATSTDAQYNNVSTSIAITNLDDDDNIIKTSITNSSTGPKVSLGALTATQFTEGNQINITVNLSQTAGTGGNLIFYSVDGKDFKYGEDYTVPAANQVYLKETTNGVELTPTDVNSLTGTKEYKDLDGDGDLDLVVTNSTTKTNYYQFQAVNIAQGQSSATIMVNTIDDKVDETDESVKIVLKAGTNYQVDDSATNKFVANLTVQDNDTAGLTITPSQTATSTSENGGFLTYTVKLNSQPTQPVTVYISSNDSSEGKLNAPTALCFDGVDDFVSLPASSLSGAITVEAWVYVDDAKRNWQRIIDFGNGPANNNIILAWEGTTGKMTFHIFNGSTAKFITTSEVFPDKQWVHVTAVNDGKGNAYIYWNGELKASGTGQNVPLNVSRTNQYIGRSNWSQDALFKGQIDEVRIWNVARSQQDIQVNQNQALNGNETGLVDYYKANEGAGTTLIDSTVNKSNGILQGGTSWTKTYSEPSDFIGLNFNATNWNTPQTFQVVGINDAIADGTVPYNIITTVTSEDPNYNKLAIAPIPLTNTEDSDTAKIIITPPGQVIEGRQNVYSVKLNSQPVGEIRVIMTPKVDQFQLNNEDIGEPLTLTFNASNWNQTQTVRVTAVDDSVVEYFQTSQIEFKVETGNVKDFESKWQNNTPEKALDLGKITGGVERTGLSIDSTSTGGVEGTGLSIDSISTDIDWYKFTLPTQGTAKDFVEIQFANAKGDLNLELYQISNSATAVKTSLSTTTDKERIELNGLAAGEYLLKVSGKDSTTSNDYKLIIGDADYQYRTAPIVTTDGKVLTALDVTIKDNDLPTAKIIAGPTASEVFGQPSYFTVQLNAPAPLDGNGIVVGYKVVGGSATLFEDINNNGILDAGEDFNSNNKLDFGDYRIQNNQTQGTVRIAPGEIQANIIVSPVDDKLVEDLNLKTISRDTTFVSTSANGKTTLRFNFETETPFDTQYEIPKGSLLKFDNGIIGTLEGKATFTDTFLNFDGKDDYVATTQSLMNNLSSFTMEGWVKANSLREGESVSLFGQNDVIEFGFSSQKLSVWTQKGGGYLFSADTTYPLNEWHHVAVVGNGQNVILYLDGVEVKKGGSPTTNYGTSADPFKIGAEVWDQVNKQPFNGQIDEVRIWNLARTEQEIKDNLNKPLNSSKTGLIAYYQANESTGINLIDSSVNKLNGTLQNGVSWQGTKGTLLVKVDNQDVSRINAATKAKITGETIVVELLPDVNISNPTYTLGGEDVNLNGKLDLSEDTNLNGKLDSGEDKNNNGKLDLSEDTNLNDKLDPDGNTSKATLSIVDDDVPGIRIVEVGNHTVVREKETATFEVSLLSEPAKDTEVKITLTPGAEIEFANPINPTTVQVDKNVYKFNTTGISNLNVELKSLVFTDQGDTVAFEIKLPQKPTKDQIVELYDANDTTKDLANTKQVTFTAEEWDGIQQGNIDGNWQEFQQVVISNLNKDVNGNYAIKAVIKDKGATSGTEINIPITRTTEKVQKQTTTLTINPTDWYKLQTVTIKGSSDDVTEPGIYHADSIKYTVTSDDKNYDGIFVPDQTIHVVDRIIDSKQTANTLGQGLKTLQDSMDNLSLPLIGSLDGVAPDPIAAFSQDLVNVISSTENLTASKLKEIIENVLSKIFGKDAFTVETEATNNEISVLLDIKKNYELFKLPLSTDLGIPALGVGLTTEGDLQANFNYNFSLGFGLHDDFGFYIDTDKTGFKTDVTVDLDQFKGQGSLGFLKLDFADDANNPSKLQVSFEASLNDLDNYKGVQFFDVNGNGQLDANTFNYPIKIDENKDGKADKNTDGSFKTTTYSIQEPFANINDKGIAADFPKVSEASEEAKRVNWNEFNVRNTFEEEQYIKQEGIYRKSVKDGLTIYYFDSDRNASFDEGKELFVVSGTGKWFDTSGNIKEFRIEQKKVNGIVTYYFDDNGNNVLEDSEKLTEKQKKQLDKNNNFKLDADRHIEGEGKFVQGTGIAFLDANNNGKLDAGEKYVNSSFEQLTISEDAIVTDSNGVTFLDVNGDGKYQESFSTVNLKTNQIITKNEFKVLINNSINKNGYRFLDLNNNGLLEGGEPQASSKNEPLSIDENYIFTNQLGETFVDINGDKVKALNGEPLVIIKDGVRFVDLDPDGEENTSEPTSQPNNVFTKKSIPSSGGIEFSYYDFNNNNSFDTGDAKVTDKPNIVTVLDDGSRLTITELVNFKKDPEISFSDLFNYQFAGEANLGLNAKTSINNNTNFPSVSVDLAVNLPLFNYGNQDEAGSNGLSVDFNNITVDLGGFISDVVKPVIGTADKIITPIKPIIQVLNADTKIFGYIGLESTFDTDGKPGVSILEIAKKLNSGDPRIDKAIKFAETVTKISEIVDLLKDSTTSTTTNTITINQIASSSVPGGSPNTTSAPGTPATNLFTTDFDSQYKTEAKLLLNNETLSTLVNDFNPNNFTFVITHGFQSSVFGQNPQFRDLGSAIHNYFKSLNQGVNVVLWDWSTEASGSPLEYQTNANKVDEIGEELAKFLQAGNINPSKTQLIGHSLGAHVMGNAGESYKTLTGKSINSIVGLDPAGPLFESDFNPATLSNDTSNNLDLLTNRLDDSDGDRVVALHTSNTLGFDGNLADLDLFVNWSDLTQPGAFNFLDNHSYATQLYTQLTNLSSFSQDFGNSEEKNSTLVGNTLDINDIYNTALRGSDYVTTGVDTIAINFGSYSLDDFKAASKDEADAAASVKPGSTAGSSQNSAKTTSKLKTDTESQANNSSKGSLISKLKGLEGLDFPILTSPTTAISLLLGESGVDLVTYDIPDFAFDFNIQQNFPIFGPISGLLEGSFSAKTDLSVGYDTYGIEQWQKSDFSLEDAYKVLDGFYLNDLNANGIDKDEFSMQARIAAGAGIDVFLLSAFVKGGLDAYVGFDLNDVGEQTGTSDGKVRGSEIISRLDTPLELFELYGDLSAFLNITVKALGINVFNQDLARIKIAEFSIGANGIRGSVGNAPQIGSLVYWDANFNSKFEGNEPFTFTDGNGNYILEIPEEYDLNRNGTFDNDEGQIVAEGGIDTTTGLTVKTKLIASADSAMVTPLTTLKSTLIQQGLTGEEANNLIKTIFNLSSDVNIDKYNPFAAIGENDINGVEIATDHIKVTNLLLNGISFLENAGYQSENAETQVIIALKEVQQTVESFSLSNSDHIKLLLTKLNAKLANSTISQETLAEIAKLVANSNHLVEDISQQALDRSISDVLPSITPIKKTVYTSVPALTAQLVKGEITSEEAETELDKLLNANTFLVQYQSFSTNRTVKVITNDILTEGVEGTGHFTIELGAAAPSQGLKILYTLSGTATLGQDYNFEGSNFGEITIKGGESRAILNLSAIDDDLKETKETISLNLKYVGNGYILDPIAKTALITINDNEADSVNSSQKGLESNGTSGNDTIIGTNKDDILKGSNGNDSLTGNAGNDILDGGAGNDTLWGGDGADILEGRSGTDSLNGGVGDDKLFGGMNNDILVGGMGNDQLQGDAGNDKLQGNEGNDVLEGGTGNDYLAGNADNDWLLGGAGEDILEGGAGADLLNGGEGADVFYYSTPTQGIDFILDFDPTQGDIIQISKTGFGVNNLEQFSFLVGTLQFNGVDIALIQNDGQTYNTFPNLANIIQLVDEPTFQTAVVSEASAHSQIVYSSATVDMVEKPNLTIYDEIINRGYLKVATSSQTTDFDREFTKILAAAIFGDATKIEFVNADLNSGFELVSNKIVDIGANHTIKTAEGDLAHNVDFSSTYFYDHNSTKEAIGLIVPENDSQWADVVRWVTYVPMQAEEFGITSANIAQVIALNTDDNPNNDSEAGIRRFLGIEGNLGAGLGLPNNFAAKIIEDVGNYGEIYERHFPEVERESNLLWTEGGLIYSPPFSGTSQDLELIENSNRNVLTEVLERGKLIVGTNGGNPGFSFPNGDGNLVGFDIDLSKALASALFGDTQAVEFRQLNNLERFTDVANGVVDITVHQVTHDLVRDGQYGVDFSPIYFYTGQGVLTRKDNGIVNLPDLNGRKIGVSANTNSRQNLDDIFKKYGINAEIIEFTTANQLTTAYLLGTVDAVSLDTPLLYAAMPLLPDPDNHHLLNANISKQPLAMVIDENQSDWGDVVGWVTHGLVQAQEYAITSQNIDEILARNTDNNPSNNDSSEIRQFLGLEGNIGQMLGLANDWAVNMIKAVGNYGEIYQRHFDTDVLRRGQNELATDFGLQTALPLRAGEFQEGSDPITKPQDLVSGTPGNDKLISPTDLDGEQDIVFTGAGDDEVDVSLSPVGDNNIFGGSGADTIYVSKSDRVFGDVGNDIFYAIDGKGGNRMSGGAGNDTFFLGAGDRALGGEGNDIFYLQQGGGNLISGGAGADKFYILTGDIPATTNTIIDFDMGTDVLGIRGQGAGFDFNDLTLIDNSIIVGNTTIAILNGVDTTRLTATNFSFI